jgi:hypothetical protein
MQSQPTEVPQNEPVNHLTSQFDTSAQHGLRNDFEPSPSPALQGEAGGDSPRQLNDTDTLSVSSGGSGRGRKSHNRRLKTQDRSAHGGSPGNRIEEYERSHLSSSRKGDSISFQVIPSVKAVNNVRNRISVDQFPNGESLPLSGFAFLTSCRGHYPYPLASATVNVVCDEPSFEALP